MQTQRIAAMRLRTLLFAVLVVGGTYAAAETKQEHVHDTSHSVMPFDMSKTTHIFKMTERGGAQRVISKDSADSNQIAMIRSHLAHEYDEFSKGIYADPAKLHGSNMPGLAEVQANAARIKVTYQALPDGAELIFDTSDLPALTAIHRWFGAQLSEHGADAKAE
jgi:hypothetical protein